MMSKESKLIIEHVSILVEKACQQETNAFGYGIWAHHIVYVVEYGLQLSQQLGANHEIVHLAALLHDYAGIKNEAWVADHHVHSAKLAGEILQDLNYPPDKIEAVQHCILSHRGSKKIPQESLEAQILASADAMAHIAYIPSLLHLAFVQKGMSVEDGTQWVLSKVGRSWEKMMPEAQQLFQARYDAIILALSLGAWY